MGITSVSSRYGREVHSSPSMRTRPLCSFTSSQHDRGTADQGGGSGAQLRRLLEVADGDRADEHEPGPGSGDECGKLDPEVQVERSDHGGDDGRDRDEAEGERHGQQFGDTEHGCHDEPDDPGHDGRSAECFCFESIPCLIDP